jgi:hypothetical protein
MLLRANKIKFSLEGWEEKKRKDADAIQKPGIECSCRKNISTPARSSLIFNSPSQTHVSQYFTTSFFSAPEGRRGNQSIGVELQKEKTQPCKSSLEIADATKLQTKLKQSKRKANAIAGFIVFKQTSSSPGSDTCVRCPKH